MSLNTIALIVGVSNYESEDFTPLPAAQADAEHFARSLAHWGVPKQNIYLLNTPFVTQDVLTSTLQKIASLPGSYKFLFYFCGHGERTEDSYLNLSDSKLHLETFLEILYQLNAFAFYIFIDACQLRLNSILNPKLLDSKKSLFCLFSSGTLPSYENIDKKYGYFTSALIRALDIIQHLDRCPSRLISIIQKELKNNNLPLPEMYNIGTDSIAIVPQNDTSDFKKLLSAVYSCGIFINKSLFCQVFGIKIENVDLLEKQRLISYKNGIFQPDDILLEIAETSEIPVEQDLAKTYWFEQLQELPSHFETALHFVLTIQCFGYEPKFDSSLLSAFKILAKDLRALDVLLNSPSIYTSITPSGLFLAEVLIEMQQFELAKSLLDSTSSSYFHLLWRTGAFSDCIVEATAALSQLNSQDAKIPFYLHRGSAYYLLGDWKEAFCDFSTIKRYSKDIQMTGRARCMLGTIKGIRGIDLKKSKLEVESAAMMLLECGDLSGAWVGWNNLGEMMWKAKDFKTSEKYLLQALAISEKLANSSMLIETLRNFLQLELRSPNRSTSKMQALLYQIEFLLEKPLEVFESMQIFNTLCTAYYYLNDIPSAYKYLRKACPLTVKSREYHIYTLSNLSLLEQSNIYFEEALTLAKEGENFFAIDQIRSDHEFAGL